MNLSALASHLGVIRTLIRRIWPAVFAFIVAGCPTRTDVANIVAESNRSLLAAQASALAASNGSVIASQLGGLPPASGKAGDVDHWLQASSRIDAFAEAHPEQKRTIAALRVRQAILLLSNKQYQLAKLAFDLAPLEDLVAERDKALKRNQAHLIWWFEASSDDSWTDDSDQAKATTALGALEMEQQSLTPGSEIRDYLGELRAWIGLTRARHATNGPDRKKHLEDALNTYAKLFTAEDISALRSTGETLSNVRSISSDLRRRMRAKAVLEDAKKLNQREPKAELEHEEFEALIN